MTGARGIIGGLRAALGGLLAVLACAPAASAAQARYDAHTVIVKYADRASPSQRSLAGRLAGVVETVGTVRGVG
ncbi:MAG TPA: hypothetical protein VGR11_04895, partial [Solirubrobacteraceae bacterium]|nr:hypothetical protein [Solirubrobacteraceae bacterium]